MINQLLARAIGVLNALLAIILVIIGGFVGTDVLGHSGGAVIGAIAGFIVALVACGMVALVIEIHAELRRIRVVLEQRGSS
jgi:hypothetical protein